MTHDPLPILESYAALLRASKKIRQTLVHIQMNVICAGLLT